MLKRNSKVKVAVVGLGYWGPNLLRNFSIIDNTEILYGCDLLEKNLTKYSVLYPNIKFVKDYKILLEDKLLNVIAIATPLSSHFLLAKKALLAGKHVFLEKPMTQDSREAKELIKLAKKKKRILMVGYTFVYTEAVKKIKSLLQKKEFGKIYYYDSTRINLGLLQKDINVVWDLACHDLSILNYIINEKPLYIQASASKFVGKQEEIADLIISYENNIKAHISVSWLSPVKIRSILIGGSKKMIVYDDISPSEKIKIYNKSIEYSKDKITPFSPAYRSGDAIIPHLEQTEGLYNELNHLVDSVRKKNKPITNGEEGLKILQLLEASDKALKTKSSVKIIYSKA